MFGCDSMGGVPAEWMCEMGSDGTLQRAYEDAARRMEMETMKGLLGEKLKDETKKTKNRKLLAALVRS